MHNTVRSRFLPLSVTTKMLARNPEAEGFVLEVQRSIDEEVSGSEWDHRNATETPIYRCCNRDNLVPGIGIAPAGYSGEKSDLLSRRLDSWLCFRITSIESPVHYV